MTRTRITAIFACLLTAMLLTASGFSSLSFANSVGGGANGATVAGSVKLAGLPVNITLTEAAPVTLPPTGGTFTNQIVSASVGALGVSILQTGLIVNTTTGNVNPTSAHAQSSSTVNDLNILGGLVTADTIVSVSTSDCNGVTATSTGAGSTIENLFVAGVKVTAQAAPNTIIAITNVQVNLLGIGLVRVNGTVTLNEQFAGGDGVTSSSLTVNQIHVNVTANAVVGLAQVVADVVIASASSSVSCMAGPPNQCPNITVAGGTTRIVQAGQSLSFNVSATDPDGNAVTLTASNLPANASFTPNPATGTPNASGTCTFNPTAGQANQTFTVNFTASDNNGCSGGSAPTVSVQINVTAGPPPNQCPSIAVAGGLNRSVQAGQSLSFNVSATDPDGNTVTLTASNLPANASFSPNPVSGTPTANGTLTFNPTAGQANQTFNVSFTATDDNGCNGGAAIPVVVQITVTAGPPPNLCPVITVTGGTIRNVQAGQSLSFNVSATDPDGNAVTLTASNLPANASFTPNPATGTPNASGTCTFNPTAGQANQTFTVNFTATDNNGCSGGTAIATTVQVTVTPGPPPNQCPNIVFSGGTTMTAEVGETLSFNVSATDPDGNTVTLSASNLPANASFSPNPTTGTPTAGGTFTFTPMEGQANQIFMVSFMATDNNGCNGSSAVPIEVQINVASESSGSPCGNRAPLISVPSLPVVGVGQKLEFIVAAVDEDGDPVTLSINCLPENATFNAATGKFEFTPSAQQLNQAHLGQGIAVIFTATDDKGAKATAIVDITPVDSTTNSRPPTLSLPPGPLMVGAGDRLVFAVAGQAQSPNCAVSLSASGLPAFATFSATTNTFSLTPNASMVGESFVVTFTATDCNQFRRSAAVQIIVTEKDSNCAPKGAGRITVPLKKLVFNSTRVNDRSGASSVSVTNSGAGPLMINSLNLSDSNNYRLEGIADLPLTLQSGGVIEFKLFFEPKSSGALPGTLTIFSSDASQPSLVIKLKGNGK